MTMVYKRQEVPRMAHCNYIVKVEVTLWVSAVWVNHSQKISAKGCLKLIKTRATVWYFSEGYQPKGVHDLIECWIFMKRISIPNVVLFLHEFDEQIMESVWYLWKVSQPKGVGGGAFSTAVQIWCWTGEVVPNILCLISPSSSSSSSSFWMDCMIVSIGTIKSTVTPKYSTSARLVDSKAENFELKPQIRKYPSLWIISSRNEEAAWQDGLASSAWFGFPWFMKDGWRGIPREWLERGDGKLGGQHGWPGCAMPPDGQGNTPEDGKVEDVEDVVVHI